MHTPQVLPAYPTIAPTPIGPQPVPVHVAITEIRFPNGQRSIVMQISTPAGIQFAFIDEAAAKKIGQDLVQLATGIVLAEPGLVRQ